ncbi:MAG: HD domain-containing protein [Oscillospiraceae bacterium]|nr:HD domain-containing protein [Oscillospiraceae bacterium]
MGITSFRDPIHGFIDVEPLELEIINSAPFQRLRHIRQLGTTYLVYHGAEHTRFGHSLGVMHLVSKAFDSAVTNYEIRYGVPLFSSDVRAHYRKLLRIIALTHDLGHPPFSHAGEGVFEDGVKHEWFTKKILHETEIAKILRNSSDITSELIWLIYGEKDSEALKNPDYILPDFKFLKGFMDSDLDCDKMDYLLRDSYYCGVNYGKYDVNRLIDSLNTYKKGGVLQLAVERGGLYAFEEFVIARHFMFVQVYFHKTRRYLDMLLSSALKDFWGNKISEDTPLDVYLSSHDGVALKDFQEKEGTESNARRFLNRDIMSCVYETPVQSGRSENNIFKLIHNLILGNFPNVSVAVDSAEKVITDIPVINTYDAESGVGTPILTNYSSTPRDLLSESNLLSGLHQPINIKRIYAEREKAEEIKSSIRELTRGG